MLWKAVYSGGVGYRDQGGGGRHRGVIGRGKDELLAVFSDGRVERGEHTDTLFAAWQGAVVGADGG